MQMLIQGFDVFGIHIQYWIIIVALIVVAAVVNNMRRHVGELLVNLIRNVWHAVA